MNGRFVALPKAEVHVHLEWCFEVDDIVSLAQENNEPLPRPREQLLQFGGGLAEFLQFLDWICGLVRTQKQLSALARRFSERLVQSGARYADVIVNPTRWHIWSRRIPDLIESLDDGFADAERDGLPSVGLCISLGSIRTCDCPAHAEEETGGGSSPSGAPPRHLRQRPNATAQLQSRASWDGTR